MKVQIHGSGWSVLEKSAVVYWTMNYEENDFQLVGIFKVTEKAYTAFIVEVPWKKVWYHHNI